MLTVVTTCNKAGYETYGKRFLASFAEHWPPDVRLLFYTEGFTLDHPRAEAHDLHESEPWLYVFKAAYRDHPRANGRGGYRWDAIRFSHKIAAIAAADRICEDKYLLWLDADIVTHNPVDIMSVMAWLPDAGYNAGWLSWLDRDKTVIGWPECGFLLFNRNHPRHHLAILTMVDMYSSGRVLSLPETHDSYVWKWLVNDLGLYVRNLSGIDGFRTMHPLINSPLGHWFDHLKGSRKFVGRSHHSDLIKPRSEEYWRDK